MHGVLSDEDKLLLSIEADRYLQPGRKDAVIRERLDMSSTRYYQRLNALLDEAAAEAHDPVLVHRLRRLRAKRGRRRAAA